MQKKWGFKAVVLMVAFFAVISFGRVEAKAATEYKEVNLSEGDTQKSGDYYFRYDSDQQKVFVSSKKNGTYKQTPIDASYFYSNGKQCYYIGNYSAVYRYVFSTGKAKKLKELEGDGNYYYTIGTVYSNYVYVNKVFFDKGELITYTYNTKTGKLKKLATGYNVTGRLGSYVLCSSAFPTDICSKITLYKIKSDGSLKKVKVISKYGRNADFVDGKLYYSEYKNDGTSYDYSQATLYKAGKDGSSPQKIATFKSENSDYEVVVYEITAKDCIVYKDGKDYRYTYSTKKFKKIQL